MRGFAKRKGFKIILGVVAAIVAVTIVAGLDLAAAVSPQSSIIGAITTPLHRLAAYGEQWNF